MIGGFNSVMKEHIRRANKGEIHCHFLSHKSQNELTELLANETKLMILKNIKDAKYFSVILDSIPDVSRKEQMTFLIRCVDVSTCSPKIEEFFLTFQHIKDKSEYIDNPGHRSDVESLTESETHGIGRFEFLFGMVIWYDLLAAVNIVSKSLQFEDMDLEIAISQLGGLVTYLKNYRETGFEKAKVEATQIAIEMKIAPVFPKKPVKRKKQFVEDVEKIDESKIAEESFRIDYFINIMDQAIMCIEIRFEQFHVYEQIFGFLFGIKRLKVAEDDELRTSCMKLEASLKHDVDSDVDGEDLFMEQKLLKDVLPKEITKPVEVLEFLKRMDSCYPNTWITYRILLTIPVS
ncbi:HAT C-terminal dimerization domain, partial [Arabidopsis suecica]